MKLYLLICISLFSQSNNGKLFDPGFLMTSPSKHAPKETGELVKLIGFWNVKETTFNKEKKVSRKGFATVSFFNRGHGYLEQLHIMNDNKSKEFELSFLAYGIPTKKWMFGIASDFTESIRVYDGHLKNKTLEVKTANRLNGQSITVFSKKVYSHILNESFKTAYFESQDYGNTWEKKRERIYTRINKNKNITREDYGIPIKNRIDEEKAFDFLIGEGNAAIEILLPTKKWVKFPSNTTGVYALNGKAIYEFNWYDVDSQNPDASSSIIRIYNKNMRRWESLYCSNRGNTLLYFGGTKQNDKIILHNFNTDATQPFSQYVFHDFKKPKHYKWHAQQSNDRGKTFNKTFIITVDLK